MSDLLPAALRPLLALCACLLATAGHAATDTPFPGRALFSTVPVIELEALHARLRAVHVVDVRSRYEFDTLHIRGARHIPLGPGFTDALGRLLSERDLPLVFYCNGKTCYKAYEACAKAREAGITRSHAFDAGVLDWARAYPDEAVLLGVTPVPKDHLIDEEGFSARLLAPAVFAERIHASDAVVLDIRDPAQRAGALLFPGREVALSLDDAPRLEALLSDLVASGKTLLVYDEAGKQIRWFQYYLEARGVRDYYFMRGGDKAFFAEVLAP